MSYQRDRETFIERMTREGLPLHVTRLLLREATGINRRAELACSSEAADRDRVKCPAWAKYGRYIEDMPVDNLRPEKYPCLCDQDTDQGTDGNPAPVHTKITRITLQDWRAEERIHKALATHNEEHASTTSCAPLCGHRAGGPCTCGRADGWTFITEGDPRGYTLRVIPPSYAERNAGKDRHNLDAIGVPAGPSRIRW